ncbi:MAG: glycosyltransferase [Xanthomonadaceae bacterium]|nr:glycosyltransferase [Xanthomonadaceae bacterium]
MKIALIHDWLTGMRGGEAVFQAICEMYPSAEIFTLIYQPNSVDRVFHSFKVHTSPLQKIPSIERNYRKFLPLMPLAVGRLDVSDFDLVISSSHCVAKGIQKNKNAKHISYVHAPMRYMWERFDDYFGPGKSSFSTRLAARAIRSKMQAWDVSVSGQDRVDLMIANSHFIQSKIKEFYKRDSLVIHPFVDWERFQSLKRDPKDFYLMVGALAPYKRVDLAIEYFKLNPSKQLMIVGDGQDFALLKDLPDNVRWLGRQSNDEITKLYSHAKAFLFPGVEDFGITPLESMSSGVPVIALNRGGATETVTIDTGVFFEEQSIASLGGAIDYFESHSSDFKENVIRAHAKTFSKENFKTSFKEAIDSCLK